MPEAKAIIGYYSTPENPIWEVYAVWPLEKLTVLPVPISPYAELRYSTWECGNLPGYSETWPINGEEK